MTLILDWIRRRTSGPSSRPSQVAPRGCAAARAATGRRRFNRRAAAVPALVTAVCLASAGPAAGSTVVQDQATGNISYTGAPGASSLLEITYGEDGTGPFVLIRDYDDQPTSTSGSCANDGSIDLKCSRPAGAFEITIDLGDMDDRLREGSPGRDIVYGGTGNDRLVGNEGNDLLDGGAGDDTIEEDHGCSDTEGNGVGADVIGGSGRDTLTHSCRKHATSVSLDGAANDGADGEGDNVAGDVEVIRGSGGGTHFVGNDLPNEFHGGDQPNVAIGGGGNDLLIGGVEDDRLEGGPGDDKVYGYGGGDVIDGGPGRDDLQGEGGSAVTDGTGGPDRIFARDGFADTISCGSGADSVEADELDLVESPSYRDACESVSRPPAGGGAAPGGTTPGTAPGGTAPGGTAPGGTAPGVNDPATQPGRLVRSLALLRGRLTRRSGLRFRMRLARAATLHVRIDTLGSRRTRSSRRLGTVRLRGRAGLRTYTVRKLKRRRLRRGRYRATITVKARGMRTEKRTLRFRIR